MLIVKAGWVLLWFALQVRKATVSEDNGFWKQKERIVGGTAFRGGGNNLQGPKGRVGEKPHFWCSCGACCFKLSGGWVEEKNPVWTDVARAIRESPSLWTEAKETKIGRGGGLEPRLGAVIRPLRDGGSGCQCEPCRKVGLVCQNEQGQAGETSSWKRWWWYSKSICVKAKYTSRSKGQKKKLPTPQKIGSTSRAGKGARIPCEVDMGSAQSCARQGEIDCHRGGSSSQAKAGGIPKNLHLKVGKGCMKLKSVRSSNLCFYSSIAAAAPLERKSGGGIRKELAQKASETSMEHRDIVCLFEKMLLLKGEAKTQDELYQIVQDYGSKLRGRPNKTSWGGLVDANVCSLLTGTQVVCITNTTDGLSVLFDTKQNIEEMVGAEEEPWLHMPAWNGSTAYICYCEATDPLQPSEECKKNHYHALTPASSDQVRSMGWPVFMGGSEPTGTLKLAESDQGDRGSEIHQTNVKKHQNVHFRLGPELWRHTRIRGDGRCFYRSLAVSVATETRTGPEIRAWLAENTTEGSPTHEQMIVLWQKKLAHSGMAWTAEVARGEVKAYNDKVTSRLSSIATWGDSDDALVYSLLTGIRVVSLVNSHGGLVVLFDSKAALETLAAIPTSSTLGLPTWKDESAHIYFLPCGEPFAVPGNGKTCNHYDALVRVQEAPAQTHWMFEGGTSLIRVQSQGRITADDGTALCPQVIAHSVVQEAPVTSDETRHSVPTGLHLQFGDYILEHAVSQEDD